MNTRIELIENSFIFVLPLLFAPKPSRNLGREMLVHISNELRRNDCHDSPT